MGSPAVGVRKGPEAGDRNFVSDRQLTRHPRPFGMDRSNLYGRAGDPRAVDDIPRPTRRITQSAKSAMDVTS